MPNCCWTEEMWDRISDETFKLMFLRPRKTLMQNVKKAQETAVAEGGFEEGNIRKTFIATQMRPLFTRLERRFEQIQDNEAELTKLRAENEVLRQQVGNVPTEEEFLTTLPVDVIMRRFKDIVLANVTPDDVTGAFKPDEFLASVPVDYLCGYAVSAFIRNQQNQAIRVEHVVKQQPVSVNGAVHLNGHAPKLPRVACVGFKKDQFQRVVDHYAGRCECVYIDKMRLDSGLPSNVDGFVIWGNFATRVQKNLLKDHCDKSGISRERRIETLGGFKNVLESVEQLIGR